MAQPINFVKDAAARSALNRWWRELHGDPDNGIPPRRGDRAELRRARSVVKASFCLAFHRLLRALDDAELPVDQAKPDDGLERLAVIAVVLAHVEQTAGTGQGSPEGFKLPNLMAASKVKSGEGAAPDQGEAFVGDPRPLVSKERFRHLLGVEELDDLLVELVRLVRQAAKRRPLDICDLASAVWRWHEDGRPARRNWAIVYYGHITGNRTASQGDQQ